MKQLLDRIGYSILGIILLVFLEGIMTLGAAFHFDAYGWMAWTIQGMLVYLAIWVANKAYDHDNAKPKRPITFQSQHTISTKQTRRGRAPLVYSRHNNNDMKNNKIKIGNDGYGNANTTVEKTKHGIVITQTDAHDWGRVSGAVGLRMNDLDELITFLINVKQQLNNQ